MSFPVVAIRPEPGCTATVRAAGTMGLDASGWPLSTIAPRAWYAPSPDAIDALLFGSANAVRHAGDALAGYQGKPAYAVGQTTAMAAREAGLSVVATGTGGLQAVVDTLPAGLRLLRLAGDEHVALHAPPGVSITTRIVYASEALPMPNDFGELLRGGTLVLLHSAAAARHFAAECDRLRVPRGALSLAALGPRIATAAGEGWACVRAADQPTEPALLALAVDMCNDSRVRGGH